MSPISLLTLPRESLHAAYRNAAQSSPHGERGERRVVMGLLMAVACLALLVAVLR